MAKRRNKQTQCPNCGFTFKTALNYCPECGQENHNHIQPLGQVVREILENTISLDTRVWRSMKFLLFKPGQLTLDYINGKRSSHVPPIRLYVFMSVVYFFFLSLLGGNLLDTAEDTPSGEILNDSNLTIGLGIVNIRLGHVKLDHMVEMPREQLDSILVASNIVPSENWRHVMRQIGRVGTKDSADYQRLYYQAVSISMFLLMPLLGLLLMLWYWRKRKFYIEYLTFSIHLFTFVFFISAFGFLANNAIGYRVFGILNVFIIPIYIIAAFKRVYQSGIVRTTFNVIGISSIYFVLMTISFLVVSFFTLWFY